MWIYRRRAGREHPDRPNSCPQSINTAINCFMATSQNKQAPPPSLLLTRGRGGIGFITIGVYFDGTINVLVWLLAFITLFADNDLLLVFKLSVAI